MAFYHCNYVCITQGLCLERLFSKEAGDVFPILPSVCLRVAAGLLESDWT